MGKIGYWMAISTGSNSGKKRSKRRKRGNSKWAVGESARLPQALWKWPRVQKLKDRVQILGTRKSSGLGADGHTEEVSANNPDWWKIGGPVHGGTKQGWLSPHKPISHIHVPVVWSIH
jgi:hypothetical protein